MALIGKSSRQSVLDDDASLFQAQEEKSEKQKWSEMDNSQRLRYFVDYYLLKCVIILAAVIGLGVVLWTTFKPRKEKMIFVAVVQDSLIPEEKENLEQQLADLFVTDADKQEVRIDDTFPTGYETEAKLAAYLNAKEIDLVITNEEHFKEMAARGSFEDLNEFMPKLAEENEGLLCWTGGYVEDSTDSGDIWEDFTDAQESSKDTAVQKDSGGAGMQESSESTAVQEDGKNTGIQENAGGGESFKAYGIRITDCPAFQNAWYGDSQAVAGVVVNSQRKENAKAVLTELFK